jgi:hypothetical protein
MTNSTKQAKTVRRSDHRKSCKKTQQTQQKNSHSVLKRLGDELCEDNDFDDYYDDVADDVADDVVVDMTDDVVDMTDDDVSSDDVNAVAAVTVHDVVGNYHDALRFVIGAIPFVRHQLEQLDDNDNWRNDVAQLAIVLHHIEIFMNNHIRNI